MVWAEEFNTWLKEKLFAFLLQDLGVEDVIKDANDKIDAAEREVQDQAEPSRDGPGTVPPGRRSQGRP